MQEAVQRIIAVTKAALEAEMSAAEFTLTEEEIKDITRYSRPAFQAKVLKSLGIPCQKRPDNTLLVLRRDVLYHTGQQAANDRPTLKSSRK